MHRVTVHRPTDLLNHALDFARGVVAAWAPSTNKEFPMPSRHIARVIGPTAYAARATAQETKAKTNAVTKAKVNIKTPTVKGVAWARP